MIYTMDNFNEEFEAVKKATPRKVMVAKEDGTVQTREGSIDIKAGAYIITDGEAVWPVNKEYFDREYDKVKEGE